MTKREIQTKVSHYTPRLDFILPPGFTQHWAMTLPYGSIKGATIFSVATPGDIDLGAGLRFHPSDWAGGPWRRA